MPTQMWWREGKREVVPRPHALAVSPHLFAGKAIIALPAIPRRDTQIATEKWQKTGRPLFQGVGLAAAPESCRVDVEKKSTSGIGHEEGQVTAGVSCTGETV